MLYETCPNEMESAVIGHETRLKTTDQSWLDTYGVDPSWQDDAGLVAELSQIIDTGSRRLDDPINQTLEARNEIMVAREQFFTFIRIPDDTLESFRMEAPTIIPLDTFIGTQRTLFALGLDAAKVVNARPAAISYAPESVRAKMNNLAELGLDAAKVVNAQPAAIGLAPESVRAKMNNLAELGLDAAKVVNALPAAISLAPESVRAKMKFLERTAKLFKWEYSAQELVQTFPSILGYNKQKLVILRKIAAYHVDESARSADPKTVRSALYIPLEKYIFALADLENDAPVDLRTLSRKAANIKLDAVERKERALRLAPSLGRIGAQYLKYRGQ